jgi:hypothetical protein
MFVSRATSGSGMTPISSTCSTAGSCSAMTAAPFGGLIGINQLDIRYELEAEGTIEGLDREISDELREDTSISAPLPLVGLDLRYRFTPGWSIRTKVSLVAGSYEETTAWVLSTSINSTYQINENISAILGLSYFDADIDINEKDERTEINYGYDGLFIGLHGLF